MRRRVREDNVWRSTLSSKQETDKDWAYSESNKPRGPDQHLATSTQKDTQLLKIEDNINKIHGSLFMSKLLVIKH